MPSPVSMPQPLAICSHEGFVVIPCTLGRDLHMPIHKFYWKTKQCNENLLKMLNCPRNVADHQEHDELPGASLSGEVLQQADGSYAEGLSDFASRWNLQHIFFAFRWHSPPISSIFLHRGSSSVHTTLQIPHSG